MNKLELDISALARGIDNQHVDVQVSEGFTDLLKRLSRELVQNEVSPQASSRAEQRRLLSQFHDHYRDMMTVLLHRLNQDLDPLVVEFVQFAVLRQVLATTRQCLDRHVTSAKTRLVELRSRGSSEALGSHSNIVWLNRRYNRLLCAINHQVVAQMLAAEERYLAPLRARLLPNPQLCWRDFLDNPLLQAADLSEPFFLIQHYRYWGRPRRENESTSFSYLNSALEGLLCENFPEHLPGKHLLPLHAGHHDPSLATETQDALGGLLASLSFMGVALYHRTHLCERLGWLEDPDTVAAALHPETPTVEGVDGKALSPRDQRKALKRVHKFLQAFARKLKEADLLQTMVASVQARKLQGREFVRDLDAQGLCQYLAGQIKLQKLLEGQSLSEAESAQLIQSRKHVKREVRKAVRQHSYETILAIVRFRRDLRHYRFAHRVFNRMQILHRAEDIRLSHQAGTLYQLLLAGEVEDSEERIAHHVVLKADIRDSTGLTERLVQQGLNPASHFSLRFFDPINSVAENFGGTKLFIEGDAVIFSFLEYESSPQQWFAVARACGMAKAMLDIIEASNRYSRQAGLPLLEVGIGICYRDTSPRYLFDGDRPIMISSAIAGADRRSSCAWQLRDAFGDWPFHVEVATFSDNGDKKRSLHFNVNGISLETAAFDKLQKEVGLERLEIEIAGRLVRLYRGEYPDTHGRTKTLYIREGLTGYWDGQHYRWGGVGDMPYYEVIADPALIGMIAELAPVHAPETPASANRTS